MAWTLLNERSNIGTIIYCVFRLIIVPKTRNPFNCYCTYPTSHRSTNGLLSVISGNLYFWSLCKDRDKINKTTENQSILLAKAIFCISFYVYYVMLGPFIESIKARSYLIWNSYEAALAISKIRYQTCSLVSFYSLWKRKVNDQGTHLMITATRRFCPQQLFVRSLPFEGKEIEAKNRRRRSNSHLTHRNKHQRYPWHVIVISTL